MVDDTLIKIKNDGVEKRYKIKASETPTFGEVTNKIKEYLKDMDVLKYLDLHAESIALYCMYKNAPKSYYTRILFDPNNNIVVSVRRCK